MFARISATLGPFIGAALFTACASGVPIEPAEAPDAPTLGVGEGILALSADMNAPTDIAGAAYTITPIDCATGRPTGEPAVEAESALSDVRLPGMIGQFEDNPLDTHSSHVMADQYFVLPAGCYAVEATLLDQDGNPSADCGSAAFERVRVRDGETTEIMLIAQCEGPAVGGLDVILVVNHPPELIDLTYDHDKFAFECQYITICATFYDPDHDPLDIEWSCIGGGGFAAGPEVVSRVADPLTHEVTECVQVAAAETGRHDFRVDAFDLLHFAGRMRRFEDWHADAGAPQQSRDGIRSMFYVNWDIEAACYDAATGELRPLPGAEDIERAPGCDWMSPAEFYCSPVYVDDPEVFCPGGQFDPSTVYPACD